MKRPLVEQGLAGLGRLLQPRGDVDGVTGGEPLLGPGNHLAATDADPPRDAEPGQCELHLRRCSEGTHCVVLVHGREPEDRHHRVADELLDDAAVALYDRLHPLEVTRQQSPQRFRIDGFPERRRADDIAEEHGDDLPLFPPGGAGLRATVGTELERAGALKAADRASGHAPSLERALAATGTAVDPRPIRRA